MASIPPQASTAAPSAWNRACPVVLAVYLVIVSALLVWSLTRAIPPAEGGVQTAASTETTVAAAPIDSTQVASDATIPRDSGATLLWIVLAAGALGACLHALVSLAEYVGNRDFRSSWALWYWMRPLVGGILALLFYLVIRAGFLPEISSERGVYGVAGLAGLVGLFSKQALYKLSDLFDVLFKSDKAARLKDQLRKNPVPTLVSVAPERVERGAPHAVITARGQDFVQASVVRADGRSLPTRYVGPDTLEAYFTAQDLSSPGTIAVSVHNPKPGGGESAPLAIDVA